VNLSSESQKRVTAFQPMNMTPAEKEIMQKLNTITINDENSLSLNKMVKLNEKQTDELLQRLMKPFEKKQRKVQQIKEKLEHELQEECTHRPKINENSRRMTHGLPSIEDRWQKNDSRKGN